MRESLRPPGSSRPATTCCRPAPAWTSPGPCPWSSRSTLYAPGRLLPLGLWLQPHAGEVEPLDGALRRCRSDHLPVGDLVAQTVRGLVRVDGQVLGGAASSRFGLGRFFFLEALAFFSLGVPGDVIVVVIVRRVLRFSLLRCHRDLLLLGFSAWAIASFWTCPGRLCCGPMASAALWWASSSSHVAVHLPGQFLHQLHHLTHELDLLVAQLLLAAGQRPLDAVQLSFWAPCFSLEPLLVLIRFLQDLCQGENKRGPPPEHSLQPIRPRLSGTK